MRWAALHDQASCPRRRAAPGVCLSSEISQHRLGPTQRAAGVPASWTLTDLMTLVLWGQAGMMGMTCWPNHGPHLAYVHCPQLPKRKGHQITHPADHPILFLRPRLMFRDTSPAPNHTRTLARVTPGHGNGGADRVSSGHQSSSTLRKEELAAGKDAAPELAWAHRGRGPSPTAPGGLPRLVRDFQQTPNPEPCCWGLSRVPTHTRPSLQPQYL